MCAVISYHMYYHTLLHILFYSITHFEKHYQSDYHYIYIYIYYHIVLHIIIWWHIGIYHNISSYIWSCVIIYRYISLILLDILWFGIICIIICFFMISCTVLHTVQASGCHLAAYSSYYGFSHISRCSCARQPCKFEMYRKQRKPMHMAVSKVCLSKLMAARLG